jgi:hypothetical protein
MLKYVIKNWNFKMEGIFSLDSLKLSEGYMKIIKKSVKNREVWMFRYNCWS